MELKDVRLKKGMYKKDVNNILINNLKLKDSVYLGWEHIHSWICPVCNTNTITRAWKDLRKGVVECDICRFGIKDSYDDIKEVYIRQNMDKHTVNNLISKWIELFDDVYLGVKHKHRWKCKCGNIIKNRTFDSVRFGSLTCDYCIRGISKGQGIKNVVLKKGMSKCVVNNLISADVSLIDDTFFGVNEVHKWMCKCGNIFFKRWGNIRKNKNVSCGCLTLHDNMTTHKKRVEVSGERTYIKSFKKGDILSNGRLAKHQTYVQYKHNYCGGIVESPLSSVSDSIRCPHCCGSYEKSFAHHIEVELGEPLEKYWDFEKNTVNPYHIYKNSKNKVWIKCQSEDVNELNGLMKKEYHESYEVYCYRFVKKQRCPYCYNRKVHKFDSFGEKYPNKVTNWHKDNMFSPYEVSPNSLKKIMFSCFECDYEWITSICHVSSGCWCPQCNKSKGEKRVKLWLDYNNINYFNDNPYFNDLIGVGGLPLRPDFILPEYKVWIEYDGEFHYKKQYNGDGYETLQIHDKLKNNYAKKHGWKMIRIPYWDFDNIENILKQQLRS